MGAIAVMSAEVCRSGLWGNAVKQVVPRVRGVDAPFQCCLLLLPQWGCTFAPIWKQPVGEEDQHYYSVQDVHKRAPKHTSRQKRYHYKTQRKGNI